MIQSARTTQPYRRGPRQVGAPLTAMLSGRPVFLPNPQDPVREAQRMARVSPFVRALMYR